MERIAQMLALMDRPAFCVADGRIAAVNTAAARRQLEVGMEVLPLLTSGADAYREFAEGCLYLGMTVCEEHYGAAVTLVDGVQVFILEPEDDSAELQALSLAAQALREPLSGVMALWDSHLEALEGPSDETASITRGLYQLLRLVGNMSAHPAAKPEMLELNALVREIWESAVPGCESRGVTLTLRSHPTPIYTQADGSLLTRAIHNLLSNALKFTAPGGTIALQLTMNNQLAMLTVRDSGGADAPKVPDPFCRYRREPGLEDPRSGLGLGLMLVRKAATIHGGAVHLLANADSGTRVTISLPIRQEKSSLRSPLLRVDYAGERSPLLIELSDVLPPEFYK